MQLHNDHDIDTLLTMPSKKKKKGQRKKAKADKNKDGGGRDDDNDAEIAMTTMTALPFCSSFYVHSTFFGRIIKSPTWEFWPFPHIF